MNQNLPALIHLPAARPGGIAGRRRHGRIILTYLVNNSFLFPGTRRQPPLEA
jgi:hypothetical protein